MEMQPEPVVEPVVQPVVQPVAQQIAVDQAPDQTIDQVVHQPAEQPLEQVVEDTHDAQKHLDQTMDVDDSTNTTITASTVVPLPSFHPPSNGNNGYMPETHRPSTSYSDTAYQYTTHNGSRFNTPSDADTPPRHGYYDASKETHMGQSPHMGQSQSRPSSQMGRYPTSEGGSRSNSYQEQNQRGAQQQQEAANKNASVVIKVGMVGDAQIGKTSLMVKYVEGSWDEDYIQTLGEYRQDPPTTFSTNSFRCQLHGKDNLHSEHGDHLLHLGPGRPARVRQHVTIGVQ